MGNRLVTIEGNRFHPLWLRDNCPCAECRHESGQRLLDTRSLLDDLSVVGVEGSTVSFSDGHTSVFDATWLRQQARTLVDCAPRGHRCLGSGSSNV